MNKEPNYLKFISISLGIIILIFASVAIFSFYYNDADNPAIDLSKYKINSGVVSIRDLEKEYYPVMNPDSPVLGKNDAAATIYQFVDFGCEYSAKMQPILKNLSQKYGDKVKIVFKDLPTQESYNAHVGARCAQKQNKFWQYSDLLWKNQKDFSKTNLVKLAGEINLNLDQFNACIVDANIETIINADIAEADNLGIPGTPHIYINKAEFLGEHSEKELANIIDKEINK